MACRYVPRTGDREMVIDLVIRLPENASLQQIAREIELLAGSQIAREQAQTGQGIPAEDARKLVAGAGFSFFAGGMLR